MEGSRRHAAGWILDSVLVFTLAAVLIWPLFQLDFSDKWASIESTFIADARFLKDHWPHPLWQPLWYTGTRFDYIYPPALRYGTAVQMKLVPSLSPARAYHIYVALLYCLGIAGVYWLARTGGGSRKFAVVAAMLVATVAPCFLFIPEIRLDAKSSWSEPQRLGVLVRYGEGPHMSAVALLAFAVAFLMEALRKGTTVWISTAGIVCALVVSNNFYGATALAMLFPILLWSCWLTEQNNRVFLRGLAAVGVSYGLCAFWLVPSYFTVTLENMRFVSERGNRWSLWVTVGLAILYMKLTEKWARGRRDLAYAVFLGGALLFFFLNVVGNYYLGFRVIGEPTRMAPELDMIIILAAVELLRRLWGAEMPPMRLRFPRRAIVRRAIVALTVFLVFYSVRKYITGGWHIFVPDHNVQARIEYQVTDWIAKNMPSVRTYTTGTVRFWFNAWYDLAQLGGGSEQGLLNPVVQPATWNLGVNEDGEYGLLWLQATGTGAAVVHLQSSKEHYHDIQNPKKFENRLQLVYNDGQGNLIYKVPRRYEAIARVVDASHLDNLPVLAEDPPKDQLSLLVDVLEKGPEAPVQTLWEGTETLHIRATVAEGQTLFVQVPYDKPWHAYSGAQSFTIRKTQLGFQRIDLPAGDHQLRLVFELPLENILGRVLTLLTLALVFWLYRNPRRQI